MLQRTDVHRPSVINPADYEYVAFECVPKSGDILGDAMWQLAERAKIRAHMERTGGTYSDHEHGGNCMVCGNANCIYTVLFYHAPTNTYVRTGQDCAQKIDLSYDVEAFNAFRRNAQNYLAARAGKRKAEGILTAAGLAKAWEVYEGEPVREYEESTITDIVGKLVKYGSISEKQTAFVGKLIERIATRKARMEQRAAETAAADPVPVTEDRIRVVGEVLSVKDTETRFGPVTKMLVKTDAGWKVWGKAVPAGVQRGDRVAFEARIEPSKDDPKFGFFARPTKAQVMEAA